MDSKGSGMSCHFLEITHQLAINYRTDKPSTRATANSRHQQHATNQSIHWFETEASKAAKAPHP
jgi:hypothetical protein